MQTEILVHYDGKVFVPDEPVDLEVGSSAVLHVHLAPSKLEERIRKVALFVGSVNAPPDFDARKIRREDLYE